MMGESIRQNCSVNIVIFLHVFLAGTVSSGTDENSYTAEVTLRDVADITLAYLRLYSRDEFMNIEFDNRAVTVKGSVDVPAWKNEIHIDGNIVAPVDHNTNMTIDVSLNLDSLFLRTLNESPKSVSDLINEMGDIFVDYVNTTADPPQLHEGVGGFFPENIFHADVKGIDGAVVNLTISFPVKYAQFGCLFSMSIPENVSNISFISRLKHGVYVRVLSPVTKEVVPQGTIAINHFPNETYIYTKRATLVCFVMGNPHPEVTMYTVQGEQYTSLASNQEELISDVYTQIVGYTVETDKTENQGQYVCR